MREKNQETRVDIIAEMRMGKPVGPCAYRIGLPDKEEVYESGAKRRIKMIKDVTVQELADRLEAAAKREKAQHGNAAAMREGLIWMKERIIAAIHDGSLDCSEVLNKIEDALKKPARNCDMYPIRKTAQIKFEESLSDIVKTEVRNYPFAAMDMFIDWLLANATKKGGAR